MAIDELIARVEAAEGSDDELDGSIFNALIGVHAPDAARWYGGGYAANITGCVDAALAFAERVLPVSSIRMTIDPSGCGADVTYWPDGLSGARRSQGSGVAVTLPLAIILATLKAKRPTLPA